MKKRAIAIFTVCVVVLLASCALFNQTTSTVSASDMSSFQKIFMSSYYAERGGIPAGAKGLTPFLKIARSGQNTGAKTTINSFGFTDAHFASLAPTTFANYPEPGQTTTFTISLKDAVNHVYDVTATTTYPSNDERQSYVEEYYLMDGNPTYSLGPDGIWDRNDAIVKQSGSSWVQDQKARVKQVLTFTDGTTRTETIIATSDTGSQTRFDPFPVTDPLDFTQSFAPLAGTNPNVTYSSVVMYYITPAANTSFWFWQGTQAKTILGIRYYTETELSPGTAQGFNSYTVSFEKTIDTLTTTGGSYAQTLQTVFAGSQFSALAETVLRQQVTYDLDSAGNLILSTGQKITNMQTRVADISSLKDFYLTQTNADYVQLSSWDTSSIYMPTGAVAQVVAADPTKFLYARSLSGAYNGQPLAVLSSSVGTGDLATLYTSIQAGNGVTITGTTIPNSVQPAGQEWVYNGTQGTSVADIPAYDLGAKGTVEAWVYINQQTDTGGIVHKGDLATFLDECWSLQFWGPYGQVAFVIDPIGATGSGGYALLTSTVNLNLGAWYYLVGTWDATAPTPYMNLYINGTLNASLASASVVTARTNSSGVHVGSQLPVQYDTTYGYFGFNGKINGVRVSTTPMSAATVASNYATYVSQTSSW